MIFELSQKALHEKKLYKHKWWKIKTEMEYSLNILV